MNIKANTLRLPVSIDLLACFYFRLRDLICRQKFYHLCRTGVYSKQLPQGVSQLGRYKRVEILARRVPRNFATCSGPTRFLEFSTATKSPQKHQRGTGELRNRSSRVTRNWPPSRTRNKRHQSFTWRGGRREPLHCL